MRAPALPILALAAAAALPAHAQLGNPAGMMPGVPMAAPGTPAPGQTNVTDRLFAQLAASGGLAEVDTARLADGRAAHPDVKAYARRMAQDHAATNDRLLAWARKSQLSLVPAPMPEHKAARAQLDAVSGPAFDAAYLRQQLVEHQKTAALLTWEIGNGQEADLQRLAADTLPHVMEHLATVQALLGVVTGAASDTVPIPAAR